MGDLITIVLPVYGRSSLLLKALESVYAQNDPSWRLLIADDGSDEYTASLIHEQLVDPRVQVATRPRNLGLFGNLNEAIHEVQTQWQLILCSDDYLKPNAIRDLKISIKTHPAVRLILSSYSSVDVSGCTRADVNGIFYDLFSPSSRIFPTGSLLSPLLQYGSINGNITGLLINQSLFLDAGTWRADWSQSADWEWLVRACVKTPVLIRREPIACVRVHDGQLSVSNRTMLRENLETLQVLSALLSHPYLRTCSRRYLWAAHHAQFLLWNAIKALPRVGFKVTFQQLCLIQKYVGLVTVTQAFVLSLPRRFEIRGTDKPLLPPF